MNSSESPVDHAALRVAQVFAAQRAAFDADPYPSAARRRANIKALRRQISRYQDVLANAMSRDFGFRAPTESKMLDLLGSTLEANHAIAHLKRWMKPSRRSEEHTSELQSPCKLVCSLLLEKKKKKIVLHIKGKSISVQMLQTHSSRRT